MFKQQILTNAFLGGHEGRNSACPQKVKAVDEGIEQQLLQSHLLAVHDYSSGGDEDRALDLLIGGIDQSF